MELATKIRDMVGNKNKIEFKEEVEDDPKRRRPDINVAKNELNWEPKVDLNVGLEKTVSYIRKELKRNRLKESNVESIAHNSDLYLEAGKDEL